MATNVKLDQADGTFLHLEARVVKHLGSDFMLDSADRHTGAQPFRRALVHDQNDSLTVNFAGDYPNGVNLVNVAQIIPMQGPGQKLANPLLVVHGGLSYEVDVLVGDKGQGADPGEVHTVTVNVDEQFNALQAEILKLTARITALEAR